MPNVTGGRGSFGGSAQAGRSASNTGTGRSSAERASQANREKLGAFSTQDTPAGRVFTSTAGLSKGISVSPTKALQDKNQERAATYNSAAGKWNNSAQQRSFANFANGVAPLGLSMEPPDIARPNTFSEGNYHLGWNPGSLAGLMSPVPGGGVITGALGQAAYSALGGKNVMLGGSGDMGMPSWDGAPGVGNSNPSGPLTPGGGQLSQNTGSSNPMAAFGQVAQAPGGAAFGAQPTAPPAQNPMAGLFSPNLPNHTVPQGYNSAFPNSLSDADKALLYAKALA